MNAEEVFLRMWLLESNLESPDVIDWYLAFMESSKLEENSIMLNPFQADRLSYQTRVVYLLSCNPSWLKNFVKLLYGGAYENRYHMNDIIELMEKLRAHIEYIVDVCKAQPDILFDRYTAEGNRDVYNRYACIEWIENIDGMIGQVRFYYRNLENKNKNNSNS